MVREVGAVSIRLLPFNILRHIRNYIFRGKPEQWWWLPTVSLFIITIYEAFWLNKKMDNVSVSSYLLLRQRIIVKHITLKKSNLLSIQRNLAQ